MEVDFRVRGLTRKTTRRWRRLTRTAWSRPALSRSGSPLALATVIAVVVPVYAITSLGGSAATTPLGGDCRGSITARPLSGYEGEAQVATITIQPPFHRVISRVITDNPACRQCEAERRNVGRFVSPGRFVGNGPFRIEFVALDSGGNVRCRGSTTELKALGPRP